MPVGIPSKPTTTFHCRKCQSMRFPTINDLRKHQWSEHRETFVKLMEAGKEVNQKQKGKSWSKVQRAKYLATMQLRRQHAKQDLLTLNGTQMSAAQLLDKLKAQRNFMNDVVALVEGVMSK